MQRPPIELLPRSYGVPPCHLLRQPACLRPIFLLPAFRIQSVGCSAETSMVPLSCRLSSATTTLDRNRSYSSQISLDQGISACRCLHRPKGAHRDPSRHRSAQIQAYSACRLLRGAKKLTEILPSTHIATARPGRSWLCRREALLLLARPYRMKGMPRAGLHCSMYS